MCGGGGDVLRYALRMFRSLLAVPFALTCAAPLAAQSAPPLTEIRITSVTSETQAERIGPGQVQTLRHHVGPVTIVLQETGIGTARILRFDGRAIAPPSSTRPLCGSTVTAGACRPGAIMTGVEITYHLDLIAAGQTLSIQDVSAPPSAQMRTAVLTFS